MQLVMTSGLIVAAIAAALVALIGLATAVHSTRLRPHGYMHLIFYVMLLMVAVTSLLSGRNLNSLDLSSVDAGATGSHVQVMMQRLVSLVLLAVSGERIVSYLVRRDRPACGSPLLLAVFVLFWICTVAAPALFGAHPTLGHEYFYSLIIGIAAALTTPTERDLALNAVRDALLLFILVGLLPIPFKTTLVLQTAYAQGYLPGVPRLAGLAPHAVSLGALTQLFLLCLMVRPYPKAWLNRLAWTVGLTVIVLAQAKTSWICFVVCTGCVIVVRDGPTFWRRVGDPFRPAFGVTWITVFMAIVLTIALFLMFGHLGQRLSDFFSSSEGEQLASLTGRAKIWAVAIDVWQRNPVFGYGPNLWDDSFRAAIGMPFATHAHNELLDALSRSGTVGGAGLVIYATVLLVLSLRYARATDGLSLALFAILFLRSISEVPLILFGYGAELITPMLLIMTLSGAAAEARARRSSSKTATGLVVPARSARAGPLTSTPLR
ncbi:MAG: hypothetical protein OJF60_000111 [Burkholderiaceae bacterium]|jgi:O-antigen ligase|nr:MAG: hypothetical protein OJF60_000111 [Burkholderiaceae bacterium]